jgi:cytochrome c peroxidase
MKYRTTPLKGLWTHQKGGFHDGRFATIRDVVEHYDKSLRLSLSEAEKTDLDDYLLSL